MRAHAAAEKAEVVTVCAAIESEIADLDDEEKQMFLADLGLEEPGLDRLIHAGYKLLGLATYFTAGVKEVRAWLDLEGFKNVNIAVSGGLDPERIRYFLQDGAPVDLFAVGSYISDSQPIGFTADLHEVDGRPIAKRGRMPGLTPNPRLKRVM